MPQKSALSNFNERTSESNINSLPDPPGFAQTFLLVDQLLRVNLDGTAFLSHFTSIYYIERYQRVASEATRPQHIFPS